MNRPARKKSPAAGATAGSGGDSIHGQCTSRARYLQALDNHPYKERLLREPDLFLRTIPEFRRRRGERYRRNARRRQILDPRAELDELRDRVAGLERQLLDVVNLMAG